ncbi:MAG: secretin N-terminal domain-containing protein [Iodobacter sp.]
MMRLQILILLFLLCACSSNPGLQVENGRHLEAKPLAENIPQPVATAPLLPKPQPAPKTATYSVVVHNVPVNEILFALGRDAKINVDVHNAVQGNVTLNAINQTLPQILERMSRQVDLRWELENGVLIVTPDIPYFKIYKINYFNLARNVKSNVTLANSVTSGSSNTRANAGNSSGTQIDMLAEHQFWKQLETNLKEILGVPKTERNNTGSVAESVLQTATQSIKTAVQAAPPAPAPAAQQQINQAGQIAKIEKDLAQTNKTKLQTEQLASLYHQPDPPPVPPARLVIMNSETGIISVRASQKEHVKVAEYLSAVQSGALRQVLIEATIVEVLLSDQYQAGVDWSRLSSADNPLGFQQSLVGTSLNSAPMSLLSYSKNGGFNLTIKMLEQFGRTRVLSSPKIMALNNQTAVMKVVEEQVYFTIKVTPPVLSSDGKITTLATYDSELHTVPIGLVMQVTPQISEEGQISLNVRPTITNINSFVEDPAVSILSSINMSPIKSLIPILQVREFDSTLKIASGQMAILGGLIQDSLMADRQGVPGLSRIPLVGDLFSYRNDSVRKIELVVFLRPVLIKDASVSGELANYQQFLPGESFFKNETDQDLSAFQAGSVPTGAAP